MQSRDHGWIGLSYIHHLLMKHYQILYSLVLLFACLSQPVAAQQIKLGGMLKTTSHIDSLNYSEKPILNEPAQGFMTKFRSKTGKLSVNLQLDILHLSHLRPVETDAYISEHTVLTQKRTQFQVKLGLVILLRKNKSPQK